MCNCAPATDLIFNIGATQVTVLKSSIVFVSNLSATRMPRCCRLPSGYVIIEYSRQHPRSVSEQGHRRGPSGGSLRSRSFRSSIVPNTFTGKISRYVAKHGQGTVRLVTISVGFSNRSEPLRSSALEKHASIVLVMMLDPATNPSNSVVSSLSTLGRLGES